MDPVAQRRGIGSSLVKTGLQRLRELGANGCMLVGDPGYYSRFGFQPEPEVEVSGVPPRNVLCIAFSTDIPAGEVTHHPAFEVER